MNDAPDALRLNIDSQVGAAGDLIGVIDTSETLDLTASGLGVDASLVGLLGIFEGGGDVDEEDGSSAADGLTGLLSAVLVRRNGGSNDGGTGLGELGSDESNTLDVLVTILSGESEF